MQRPLSVLILSATLFGNVFVSPSYTQTPSTGQGASPSNLGSHSSQRTVTCADNGTYVNKQGQRGKRAQRTAPALR